MKIDVKIKFNNCILSLVLFFILLSIFFSCDNREKMVALDSIKMIESKASISTIGESKQRDADEVEKINTEKLDDKELIKSIREEIEKKDLEIPYGVKPATLSQIEFHPEDEDIFGNSEGKLSAISSVIRKEEYFNGVAITFDSGEFNSRSYIYEIMDILETYGARATFFLTYQSMITNPKKVIDIVKRGHEIGNHSKRHIDFRHLDTDEKKIDEIMTPHVFVKKLTGIEMSLFRFPYGGYNNRSVELVKAAGYYPIQWSIDSIDWRDDSFDILYERLINEKQIRPGDIILFHVTAENTPLVLPYLLERIKNEGYKCVPVSELIIKHNFKMWYGKQLFR